MVTPVFGEVYPPTSRRLDDDDDDDKDDDDDEGIQEKSCSTRRSPKQTALSNSSKLAQNSTRL